MKSVKIPLKLNIIYNMRSSFFEEWYEANQASKVDYCV